MRLGKKYFDEIRKLIDEIEAKQMENIGKAAEMIAEAIASKKNIFAFGCNHAGLITQDLFYRTGGLAIINPVTIPGMILDARPITLTTGIERLGGYGAIIAESCKLNNGDILIMHSVSGRNSVPVDTAIEAKKRGAKVIALTNKKYSIGVSSRHPSGKRLFEAADLVLDNCGCYGDSALDVKGMNQKIAPTSTVSGAAILTAVTAEAVELLTEMGITPPVFISSNVDGGDEHNKKILSEYKDNIFYM